MERYFYSFNGMKGAEDGDYVLHSDYLKLKEALREALKEWKSWNNDQLEGPRGWLGNGKATDDRIAALRKEFDLDD